MESLTLFDCQPFFFSRLIKSEIKKSTWSNCQSIPQSAIVRSSIRCVFFLPFNCNWYALDRIVSHKDCLYTQEDLFKADFCLQIHSNRINSKKNASTKYLSRSKFVHFPINWMFRLRCEINWARAICKHNLLMTVFVYYIINSIILVWHRTKKVRAFSFNRAQFFRISERPLSNGVNSSSFFFLTSKHSWHFYKAVIVGTAH